MHRAPLNVICREHCQVDQTKIIGDYTKLTNNKMTEYIQKYFNLMSYCVL